MRNGRQQLGRKIVYPLGKIMSTRKQRIHNVSDFYFPFQFQDVIAKRTSLDLPLQQL